MRNSAWLAPLLRRPCQWAAAPLLLAAAAAGARERIAAQAVRLNLGVVSVPDLDQLTNALSDETAGVLLHGSLDGVEPTH